MSECWIKSDEAASVAQLAVGVFGDFLEGKKISLDIFGKYLLKSSKPKPVSNKLTHKGLFTCSGRRFNSRLDPW